MHDWILNQNIAPEQFYSQDNYEFMFTLSDTKNGKNGYVLKNRIMSLGGSADVDAK